MPPPLENATGRLYFRSIQTKELITVSDDGTKRGALKLDQTAEGPVLQSGSTGAKLIIGEDDTTFETKTGVAVKKYTASSIGTTTSEADTLIGLKTSTIGSTSVMLQGLHADQYPTTNDTAVYHTLVQSTKRDLVLSGNSVLVNDGTPGHVVTVGELHTYPGDGKAASGGTSIRALGKHLVDAATNTYESASLDIGVRADASFASTGSSATRAIVSSTSNADLSVQSGRQLRLMGDAVLIGSTSSVKFFPSGESGQETTNPHGFLEIAHANDNRSEAITISTPQVAQPVDIIVRPGTSKMVAEADSFEMGSGDTRYRFTIINGQLRINKRVLGSADPEKTIFVFDS
eukprot:jgi/Mesvir1/16349/Mv18098-RA.1